MTTRRDFLKAAPLAVSAAVVSPSVFADVFRQASKNNDVPRPEPLDHSFRAYLGEHRIPKLVKMEVAEETHYVQSVSLTGRRHSHPVGHDAKISLVLDLNSKSWPDASDSVDALRFMGRVEG